MGRLGGKARREARFGQGQKVRVRTLIDSYRDRFFMTLVT